MWLNWRPVPFVLPSVSLQTNLWKYKSCEKETSSSHICPFLPPSVSLHSITPSLSQSIHQQQWCAVIIVRASLRLSVYMQDPSGYLSVCLCVYILVNTCMWYYCVTNLHFLEQPLTWVMFSISVFIIRHILYARSKRRIFPAQIWLCCGVNPFVSLEDICCSLSLKAAVMSSCLLLCLVTAVSPLISQEWREECVLKSTTSQRMQTLTMTGQSTSYVSWKQHYKAWMMREEVASATKQRNDTTC